MHASEYLRQVRERLSRVVVGQDLVIDSALIAVLTSGHLLLEGEPGLAKTLVISALSKILYLDFGRIQFPNELLPSDLLGVDIGGRGSGELMADQGPVFTNLLLAEEINQATPLVQASLLEAMQERRITAGCEIYPLPTPFVVIATKGLDGQPGASGLAPALLDRFMLCHRLRYPSPAEEDEILRRHLQLGLEKKGSEAVARSEFDLVKGEPIGAPENLIDAMEVCRQVHVSEGMRRHAMRIIENTRRHPDLEVGCSPRASISLLEASRARALILGRDQVILKDLISLAEDACIHRIRLTEEAIAEGKSPRMILQQIMTASTS